MLTEQKDRPICPLCNKRLVKCNGITKTGIQKWQKFCGTCHKKHYKQKKNSYRNHKKGICSRCGFVPEDKCQLDIHHQDGNHKNNNKDNLITLCSNCHRLVTKLEKQGIHKHKNNGETD
jgi:hypothetical protein